MRRRRAEARYTAADELEAVVDTEEIVGPPLAALDLRGPGPAPGAVTEGRAARGLSLLLALGAITTLGPLAIDMYLPALPEIARDLQSTTSAVQLSLAACLAGMAAGQLIIGPMSDHLGRRKPLLIGLLGFTLASLACAFATSVATLVGLRLAQGLAGSAGLVIARAVVRDLYDGVDAARYYSRLMVVTGVAPVLAPLVGAQVLAFTSWRGVFVALALAGALLVLIAALWVPETWRPESRPAIRLGPMLRDIARLTRDRRLMGYALASGLAFAAMFAYIAGSPFVMQNVYGASPQLFSVVFGINAVGLVLVGQLNGQLVGRFSPRDLLLVGTSLCCAAGLALLAVVILGIPGLSALLLPLFVLVSSLGLVMPNATALGLSAHARHAGAASALLGVMQFIVGAVAAPLVGLGGDHTALPMAIVIAAVSAGSLLALVSMTAGRGRLTA